MSKRKMHKWKTDIKWFSLCGHVPQEDEGSHRWEKVTCARCLKKRGKGKRDERQTPFNPGNRNPLGRD